jgi:hypothetical protein
MGGVVGLRVYVVPCELTVVQNGTANLAQPLTTTVPLALLAASAPLVAPSVAQTAAVTANNLKIFMVVSPSMSRALRRQN